MPSPNINGGGGKVSGVCAASSLRHPDVDLSA